MNPKFGPFPKNKPSVGSILMTHFGSFCHVNELPRTKIPQLIQMAEDGYKGFDNLNHVLGSVSVLMSDVPAEPLLSATANRKGSTLGIVSVTYLLHRPDCGQQVRRILEAGDGVMILRIYGKLDLSKEKLPDFEAKVELFDSWTLYQQYVLPIVVEHDLTSSRDGSIFS